MRSSRFLYTLLFRAQGQLSAITRGTINIHHLRRAPRIYIEMQDLVGLK